MVKKIFISLACIFFGLSLGFVNDYLGSQWSTLYLDLVMVILSIGLFWKKTAWMVIASSITIFFLYLLDHQLSIYNYIFIKPLYLLLLAIIHSLLIKNNKIDTGLEVIKK